MCLRTVVFHDHPNLVFISFSAVTTYLALRPAPSVVPIVLTLTSLLLYSRILIPSRHALAYSVVLWFAIALSGTLSRLGPSLDALSTPLFSIISLFCLSGATSLLTLISIYIDTKLCARLSSSWSQITLFPAIWTSLWFAVACVSPVGRLSAWAPVLGTGAYDWMLPVVGPGGVDWVVSAWAVVCSQAIGMWFIGSAWKEDNEPLIPHDTPAPKPSLLHLSHADSSLLLAVLLTTLAVPSLLVNTFPTPIISPQSTPISVGCVLPTFRRYKRHSFTLDDYIDESKKLISVAKIALWPEGAVVFNSEAEREEGLAKVHKAIEGSRSYVGVSFEETFTSETARRAGSKRTGLALISRFSSEPHFVYYKRYLVPIAESFSLTHSALPPTMFTLDLPNPWPKEMNKSDWAPAPNYTRPIPLTSSICLDFADPSPFADLDSRPALILAPARTWDRDVGYAMWQQAKQRAEELGSIVLWCDGGDGGLSGVAGGGFSDFTQVGMGSWARAVGLQYPFDERRTIYAYLGSVTLLLFWVIVLGGSFDKVLASAHLPRGGLAKRGIVWVRNTLKGQNGRDNEAHADERDLLG